MPNPVHIMAGGPSNNTIRDVKPIIAVNKDILRYKNADYFITCDISFTRHHRPSFENIKGLKVFATDICEKRIQLDDLQCYDLIIKASSKPNEFGKTFKEFATGMNSGFTAIQFAILMGYDEIHIYGIDLVIKDSHTHWHEGYGHGRIHLEERYAKWLHKFKSAIENQKGVRFVSHSKISRLNELKNVEVS